jgi:protein farnesyltransferase/geranylgeranyltransferase type-1 subunit alpha
MDDLGRIAQDDGPAPVVRIKYTAEFGAAMDRFRALVVAGECSARGLEVTEAAINCNAANYTAWAYRRRCLAALDERATWEAELGWSAEQVRDNPKNYQVWFHRRRIVEHLDAADAAELQFVAECLLDDLKNYHAWGYRQWLLKANGGLWADELAYTAALIADDPYNNSAWNQRHFALAQSAALASEDAAANAAAGAEELDFARRELRRGAENESPYAFMRAVADALAEGQPAGGGPLGALLVEACRQTLRDHADCAPAAGALVDALARVGGSEALGEATSLCHRLATRLDPIRSQYWALREAQVGAAAVAMGASAAADAARGVTNVAAS